MSHVLRGLDEATLFTLEWLGERPYSLYGECKGPMLDRLIGRGLAFVTYAQRSDWSEVYLTAPGRRARERLLAQQAAGQVEGMAA